MNSRILNPVLLAAPITRSREFAFSAVFGLTLASGASAQNINPAAGRIETARSVPSLESLPGIRESVRPGMRDVTTLPRLESDAEYGEQRILRRVQSLEEWRVSLGTEVYWSSNVALSSSNELDDVYLKAGVAAEFTPQIAPNVFGSFSLRHHSYLYDEFPILDFTDLEAGAGLAVNIPQLANTLVFARYEFQTLFDDFYGEKLFHDHAGVAGASKTFAVGRGQRINIGTRAKLSLDCDPEAARRHEYGLFAGYSVSLTDKFSAGFSYVGSFYDYTKFGREDFNHAAVLSASYQITDWASVRGFVNFIYNNSNVRALDYEVWLPGGGVMLQIQF